MPSSRRVALPMIGAVTAAIAASACCLVPAALAVLGMSGAGFAARFAPYRTYFLIATVQGGIFKVDSVGTALQITDGRNRKATITATAISPFGSNSMPKVACEAVISSGSGEN